MQRLSTEENVEGIATVRKAIKYLTNDSNRDTVTHECTITATVNGELLIDSEIMKCNFIIDYDGARVSVFWEDYGYKNYKKLGLFGQMSTQWQPIKEYDNNSFTVTDAEDSYLLTIEY